MIAHGASRGSLATKQQALEGAIESCFPIGLSFAATRLATFTRKPTACAVGYNLSLLRSYLPPFSEY